MKLIYDIERYHSWEPVVPLIDPHIYRREVELSFDDTCLERLVRARTLWQLHNIGTEFAVCGIRAYVSLRVYAISMMNNDHPKPDDLHLDLRNSPSTSFNFYGVSLLLCTTIHTDTIAIVGGMDMLSVHLSRKMTHG